MEWYALPGVQGDTAFELERNSKAMLDHYTDFVKERILKDGHLATVAIFRSETKENIVDCGPMMTDEDRKDRLAATLRKMACEFEAVGFVFIAEAWTAKYDKDDFKINKIMPSQRPDRAECVIVSAQYKGDKSTMRVSEIIRDQDGKITHLLEKDFPQEADGMTFEGRFAGILDDESEGDRWARMMRDL